MVQLGRTAAKRDPRTENRRIACTMFALGVPPCSRGRNFCFSKQKCVAWPRNAAQAFKKYWFGQQDFQNLDYFHGLGRLCTQNAVNFNEMSQRTKPVLKSTVAGAKKFLCAECCKLQWNVTPENPKKKLHFDCNLQHSAFKKLQDHASSRVKTGHKRSAKVLPAGKAPFFNTWRTL